MKRFGILLLLALSGSLAHAQKAIPEFAGEVPGSIEDVHCTSLVGGKAEDITTVQSRIRTNVFVSGMVIRAHWFDETGKFHFADFDVVVANYDHETISLQVVGASAKRNSLELKIDLSSGASSMFINGKLQSIPNLTCDAPIAG
jgi:hypothetical protein